MHFSLQKIFNLPNEMTVYCGHEYTKNNLKFLEHIFDNNNILKQECEIVSDFRQKNKYSNFDFFKFLREKKDDF